MRDYIKPFIEDEDIELEDIIATSNGGTGDSDTDGLSDIYTDLFD